MAVIMTSKNFVSKVITHPPKLVKIANIEAELDLLWAQFNQKINDGQTVMRACMSNLIIYCDNAEELQVISKEITAIVDVHPARVLLLMGKGQPKTGNLDASVAIYYTPQPDGWQVCGERIDVIATEDSTERLPSVARSQLIGDLPTTLWWASRQPPPEAKEVFFQLAKLANQIIYDNMGWTNPAKAVAAMTRWVSAEQDVQIVYGLAWRRFSIWRKLIREVLDPQVAPNALANVSLIELDHGPHALPMTWLLVGWLSSQLKWRAVEGRYVSDSESVWRFRHNHRDIKVIARRLPQGEPLIYRLLFDWDGDKGRTCFERLENERIGIVETLSTVPARVFNAQTPKRATLVSAQLAHRDRDKVFENAMKACNAMADVFQK
jgi:glucose-6-phosphate dehydrogenase assembly protein OpcA